MPGSICDVLPAAAALLGVPGAEDRLRLAARLGAVRRVAVVLVDGLGQQLLPLAAPHAPLLADALAGRALLVDELHCEFPSTTPTSLVSLGTGARPGAHGVLGFTVRVPDTGRLLTHVRWRADPDPDRWQPLPTWFERSAGAGVAARAVLPGAFAGSGLTRAAYRGAAVRAVPAGEDYAEHLSAEVRAGPGLVYGYTAELDTAAHLHGIDSAQWRAAARAVDTLLERVLETLPEDAALLVTADHGGLNVAADARVDVDADARLRAGVVVVAGEPRVRYLHTGPGAVTDVLDTWRGVLGDTASVLARDDAIARDLFGPVPDEHRGRIGDVVVICTAPTAVLATATEPPEIAGLIGLHGGLRPEEVAIPLLGWRAG